MGFRIVAWMERSGIQERRIPGLRRDAPSSGLSNSALALREALKNDNTPGVGLANALKNDDTLRLPTGLWRICPHYTI